MLISWHVWGVHTSCGWPLLDCLEHVEVYGCLFKLADVCLGVGRHLVCADDKGLNDWLYASLPHVICRIAWGFYIWAYTHKVENGGQIWRRQKHVL